MVGNKQVKDKLPSFEKAVEELESIVDRIEAGDIDLEQSLTIYERGTKLVAHCRAVLDQAQKKIAELTVDEQGRLKAQGNGETADSADNE